MAARHHALKHDAAALSLQLAHGEIEGQSGDAACQAAVASGEGQNLAASRRALRYQMASAAPAGRRNELSGRKRVTLGVRTWRGGRGMAAAMGGEVWRLIGHIANYLLLQQSGGGSRYRLW